jgi:hypothetical protein
MSSKFLYGNLNERQFDMLDLLVCCGAMIGEQIRERIDPGVMPETWERWLSRQHAGSHVTRGACLSIGAIIEEHDRLCAHPHRSGLGRKVQKGMVIPIDERSQQPIRWRVSENGMYQYNLALDQLDMMAQMGVTKDQMIERSEEWGMARKRMQQTDKYRRNKLRLAHSA